jgi:hypothetical protein
MGVVRLDKCFVGRLMNDLGKKAAHSFLKHAVNLNEQQTAEATAAGRYSPGAAKGTAARQTFYEGLGVTDKMAPGLAQQVAQPVKQIRAPQISSSAAPAASNLGQRAVGAFRKWAPRIGIGAGVVGLGGLGAAALMASKSPPPDQGMTY